MSSVDIKTVLLVDDDPSIRKIGLLSLSRVGQWSVTLAASGLQALDLVSNFKPDVILLDVMMPNMDGPTTLKRLMEKDSIAGTPIIFITAKVQKHEISGYCDMGAAGVISKPFDPMKLPIEIQNIVDSFELREPYAKVV